MPTDKAQIQQAKAAYNELTQSQRKYVINYAQLVKIEAQLKLVIKREKSLTVDDIRLSLPPIYTTTTILKGKITPGAQLVVYSGSKKIKTATVSKEGLYSMKIPAQKAGTTLKFIVLNEIGDKLVRKYATVTKKK